MTDGNLPAALTHLGNALNELHQPQNRHTDSLYEQLADAIPGTQGNGRHIPGSSPPLNLDAVDLKNEIDTALQIWKLDQRKWRPQDCDKIKGITKDIRTWVHQIKSLLDPTPTKELSAACPNCNHTHAYHYNASGDYVRGAALQITSTGCTCLRCHTTWPPDRYLLLCRILGFDTPAGVIE